MICCDKVGPAAGGVLAVGLALTLLWPHARHRLIYPGGELSPESADPTLHGLPASEQVWIEAEDGVRIHAWWTPARPRPGAGPPSVTAGTPAPAASRGTVVYCHGNAESIATRAWIADRLSRMGFDVLLFDYRGYGLSEGRPTEEGLARDARAAWRHVVETRRVPGDRVFIMGHSLGSAVAGRLALDLGTRPAGLVVGSPFPSMPDVFASHAPWLPDRALRWDSDRHQAGSRLSELQVPLLVVIGTEDTVIPPELSFQVSEDATGPTTLVAVPANHDTVMGHADVWEAVETFLEDALDS